ncbi:MAG TPA: chemotaxis response regulator protein-glutamate methylesterase [Pseudobacteroides sp.]|uniref:protein-glutamate methylesterase/protein-glutamine glutaminase n=1 Tax=Pseudobacteroides sp. TaxID=1968840 RepID=UPI002F93689D
MVKIKVLIVDDSALMRKAIKEILSTDSSLEVVGFARDGEDAILKARELMPDVITMDINMPLMDGLTSMQHILNEFPNVAVIVLSSLSQEGALITFEALELGAFDFVAKPSGTVSSNIYIVGKEIIEKVKAGYKYSRKNTIRGRIARTKEIIKPVPKKSIVGSSTTTIKTVATKVVVIGISTGGPNTLMEVLPMIPADLKAAIIIVQHMPPAFTSTFAKRINDASMFDIKEAEIGDKVINGKGFLAPGGYHLVVRKEGIRLTSTPKTLFMPSVNVTMESVLECYGGKNVIGVLMTGMGDDGADAMVKIRKAGGITIAEDESTAVVFGMPREAIERGGAEIVAPSHRIPNEIIRAVMR